MKKFFYGFMVVIALVSTMLVGCKKQAWNTEISGGSWIVLLSSKGEKIYDGPKEFIDDEYERDALTNSEYNWIWNLDKQEFDKVERGSCIFTE